MSENNVMEPVWPLHKRVLLCTQLQYTSLSTVNISQVTSYLKKEKNDK